MSVGDWYAAISISVGTMAVLGIAVIVVCDYLKR